MPSSGEVSASVAERVSHALDRLRIELPSWGFANTGTRFGKFLQPAAAVTTAEKIADAGQVHALTGSCPTVALHVLWDLPRGLEDVDEVARVAQAARPAARRHQSEPVSGPGVQARLVRQPVGGHPRARAVAHCRDSVAIAQRLGSRDVSLWFADGSNYPGTANIRARKRWFEEGLAALHASLSADQRLLVEYKPFEPAFYHTDIADWGMALLLRVPPDRRPASSWTPATTISRRTSSRSSPGCWPRACSAASTSTTAATPTTT